MPTYDDDRMFSAYIITKRSGSEYSSEEEAQVSPPSSNSNLNESNNELSDEDSGGIHKKAGNSKSDSSGDSLSTFVPTKKDPVPVSKNRFRKFSWISSDDDSSSSDETESKNGEESMSFLKSLSSECYIVV